MLWYFGGSSRSEGRWKVVDIFQSTELHGDHLFEENGTDTFVFLNHIIYLLISYLSIHWWPRMAYIVLCYFYPHSQPCKEA